MKSFSEMVDKQRRNNSAINKAPIMQTMFIENEDDLNRWGYNEAPIDIHEIESMCPNASVVPNTGSIEIIWFLPSGNHPGLWIHEHDYGCFVTVTGSHFDYPEDESISRMVGELYMRSMDFINMHVNVPYEQRKGMDKEQIFWYVRKMNDVLGPMSNPKGIPLEKSKVKKEMLYDRADWRGRWTPFESDIIAQQPYAREELIADLNTFIYHCEDLGWTNWDNRIKQAYDLLKDVMRDTDYHNGNGDRWE